MKYIAIIFLLSVSSIVSASCSKDVYAENLIYHINKNNIIVSSDRAKVWLDRVEKHLESGHTLCPYGNSVTEKIYYFKGTSLCAALAAEFKENSEKYNDNKYRKLKDKAMEYGLQFNYDNLNSREYFCELVDVLQEY